MSKEFFIFPYKAESEGAKKLSEALDCYRISRTNSRFTRSDDKIIINWGWGNTLPTEVAACPIIINQPASVEKAIDKIKTFQCFREHMIACPDWTTNRTEAESWWRSGYTVYCRTQTSGHDGSGLVAAHNSYNSPVTVVDAPLYTRGISGGSTNTEYRVTVFGEDAISYQKKVIRSDFTGTPNHLVRTSGNGWGFDYVSERDVPHQVDAEAIASVQALGLDFGGVDVLYSTVYRKAYVLEVNTAPELTPFSLGKLKDALLQYKESLEE